MQLVHGTRLGAYEIVGRLGAGGMGEVYRAVDIRLDRHVALKVLPEAMASDPERTARFQREAKVLASLNHPHIAALFGFEEAGGRHFLTMELVDGETLADRIARGPIPVDEALPIARQIADALEAAHEQGVVHRDLKPANIKLRPDGTVKVLDFGLAKALTPETSGAAATLSNSPTITSPVAVTGVGVLLGTAGYMSPEQAKGKSVDKRSDMWAFGCVLYEMLAGRPAFGGETVADITVSVLTKGPDWTILPPDTPSSIRSVLRRCLEKQAGRRFHHIADARLDIEEAFAEPSQPGHYVAPPRQHWFVRFAGWLLAVVLTTALISTWFVAGPRPLPPTKVTRLELNAPPGVEIALNNATGFAISQDGQTIAFGGVSEGTRRLYTRRLDGFEATPVRGTETSIACFFSPDATSLAFTTNDGTLKKVSLSDGLVSTLMTDVDYVGNAGVWAADGRIVVGRDGALWIVPPSGGQAAQLTWLDPGKNERLHLNPAVIPGTDAILFEVVSDGDGTTTNIEAVSLSSGKRTQVIEGGRKPLYAASGHLLFYRNGSMHAVPFDLRTRQPAGRAVAVLDGISLDQIGTPFLVISQDGSLAYSPTSNATKRLVWVSREGSEQPITDAGRPYQHPRLSKDGRRIVVEVAGGDLWIQDIARGTFTKVTSGSVGNAFPAWTPDGRRIFLRTLTGVRWVDADDGRSSSLPDTSIDDIPSAVSPDGRTLAVVHQSSETGYDIYTHSLLDRAPAKVLVKTAAYDGAAEFSPDGRWVAYVSNEDGRFQIYLRPFPDSGARVPVSIDGGINPKWNPRGGELFYRSGTKMMVVSVSTTPDLRVSKPSVLFDRRFAFGGAQTIANYDVSPDGQRFVMVKDDSASGKLNVVLNWFEELKRLAPTD